LQIAVGVRTDESPHEPFVRLERRGRLGNWLLRDGLILGSERGAALEAKAGIVGVQLLALAARLHQSDLIPSAVHRRQAGVPFWAETWNDAVGEAGVAVDLLLSRLLL
jgi:hypothetical protein